MNRIALGFAASVVAFGAMSSAQAVLISGDFTRSVGGVPTTPVVGDTATTGALKNADGLIFTGQNGVWNGLHVGPSGNLSYQSFTSGFLHDGDGVVTTARFQILPSGLLLPNGNSRPAYRGGASTVNTPAPNLRHEFAGIHTGQNTPPFMNWLISGLDPDTLFDMTIFGGAVEGAGNDNLLATMITNGLPGTKDSEGDWNWSGMTNAAGELHIQIAIPDTGGAQSRYFGFQLQSVPGAAVPEPATLSLGAIGLAALVFRRRRAVV